MREILARVEQRVAELGTHPLFAWLADERTSAKDRMMILPSVAPVALGFRDVNRWVLRYPRAADEFERGINVHTFEDQTHARLFLEDWARLGLDRRLGWDASDTLWWLFRAEANEAVRARCVYFQSIAAADRGDPLLRFAHAEVGELCARSLFFEHISKVAAGLESRTGLAMRYFGAHHIEAEGEGAGETFESVVLDGGRRRRAVELSDVMIEAFRDILDAVHRYALDYVAQGAVPRPLPPRAGSGHGRPGRSAGMQHRPMHPFQETLGRLVAERRARHAAHPFYTWVDRRGRVSAVSALQRFVPLTAIDALGYPDIARHAVRYSDPASPAERTLNAWVDRLAARADLFRADWKQLDLDEMLGWNASDTLEFYSLHRTTDLARRARLTTIRTATEHSDPMVRLWLTRASTEAAEAFRAGTARLVSEAEVDGGLALDHLAGRGRVEAPDFGAEPIGADARDAAAAAVASVFDLADQQLDLTLDVALSNDFRIP